MDDFSERFFTRNLQRNLKTNVLIDHDHPGDKGPDDLNEPLEDSLEVFDSESGTKSKLKSPRLRWSCRDPLEVEESEVEVNVT